MRLLQLSALTFVVETALAYLDTSPFFMFSTSSGFQSASTTHLQTSAVLNKDVYSFLSQCPSEYYIIVAQPGVSSSDYTNSKTTPVLARNLSPSLKTSKGILSQFTIPELLDRPNTASWERILSESCDVEALHVVASSGAIPSLDSHKLLTVTLPAPSRFSRAADLNKNDAFFASVLDLLPSQDYTVLYVTEPSAQKQSTTSSTGKDDTKQYEMESPLVEIMHQELKRDMGVYSLTNKTTNQTIIDGPLFDKYQFLGPGIFMGFTVGIILLLILYVGISALSSLQVTYAAFDRESGPLAGKKGQ